GTYPSPGGACLWKPHPRVSVTPTSIPRCSRVLAELCNDQVPVEMVGDEHQFGHWARCIGMADLATGKIAAAHVSIIKAKNPSASSLKPLYPPHAEALVALYRMRTEHAEHLARASIATRLDPGCSI